MLVKLAIGVKYIAEKIALQKTSSIIGKNMREKACFLFSMTSVHLSKKAHSVNRLTQ